MQYHLDTIPVWEAMEQNTACPLCALYRRVEASEIERSLGGSVMEPDARIRVNDALQKQDARQTECRHMKLCRHDFPFRFRPAALTKTGVHSQREDARSGSEQA